MKHSHGDHGAHAGHDMHAGHGMHGAGGNVANHVAKGAAMSAGAHTGKKLMSTVQKHPILLFGAGIVAGYFIHKYRHEIISSVSGISDKGKDFVLQQKENLEDLVAESKEQQEK